MYERPLPSGAAGQGNRKTRIGRDNMTPPTLFYHDPDHEEKLYREEEPADENSAAMTNVPPERDGKRPPTEIQARRQAQAARREGQAFGVRQETGAGSPDSQHPAGMGEARRFFSEGRRATRSRKSKPNRKFRRRRARMTRRQQSEPR